MSLESLFPVVGPMITWKISSEVGDPLKGGCSGICESLGDWLIVLVVGPCRNVCGLNNFHMVWIAIEHGTHGKRQVYRFLIYFLWRFVYWWWSVYIVGVFNKHQW